MAKKYILYLGAAKLKSVTVAKINKLPVYSIAIVQTGGLYRNHLVKTPCFSNMFIMNHISPNHTLSSFKSVVSALGHSR